MSDISEQIKSKFSMTIKCLACGSENAGIDFYAGFVCSEGGITGHLIFACEDCDAEIAFEDD